MVEDGTAVKATRRRGAALEAAVLQAAAEELAEVGYPGLTMDRVAARAGTSKNVIYRRWPNRTALSIAAWRSMLPSAPDDVPDTGTLRDDALAMLRRTNDRMAAPFGAVLRGLLAGMQDDPERLREIREQLGRIGVGPWLTILARAVTRGEADPAALTPRVATVAVDLLRNEYGLNGMTTADDGLLVEIVDEVYLPLVRPRR
jgi:AcrR family transcriptional regulator